MVEHEVLFSWLHLLGSTAFWKITGVCMCVGWGGGVVLSLNNYTNTNKDKKKVSLDLQVSLNIRNVSIAKFVLMH